MINVEDVVRANIFCMEHPQNFGGSVYEVGTGENISLNQIKELVNRHFPEVDFESDGWEDEYQKIIDNRLEWGDKAKEYFDLYWTPEAIVDYFVEKIEENDSV